MILDYGLQIYRIVCTTNSSIFPSCLHIKILFTIKRTRFYIQVNEILKRRLLSCMVHCNGLCYKEKNINAAFILELNSKCTSCEIAFNTDEYRCYCCSGRLRKRSTRANRSIVAKLKNDQKIRY